MLVKKRTKRKGTVVTSLSQSDTDWYLNTVPLYTCGRRALRLLTAEIAPQEREVFGVDAPAPTEVGLRIVGGLPLADAERPEHDRKVNKVHDAVAVRITQQELPHTDGIRRVRGLRNRHAGVGQVVPLKLQCDGCGRKAVLECDLDRCHPLTILQRASQHPIGQVELAKALVLATRLCDGSDTIRSFESDGLDRVDRVDK